MFGVLSITLGLLSAAGLGWTAHDVAQNGLHVDVPAVLPASK